MVKYQILPYGTKFGESTTISSWSYVGDERIAFHIWETLMKHCSHIRFKYVSLCLKTRPYNDWRICWEVTLQPDLEPVPEFDVFDLNTPHVLEVVDIPSYLRGLSQWLRNSN